MQWGKVIHNGNIGTIFKESCLIFDVDNKIPTIFRNSQGVGSKLCQKTI